MDAESRIRAAARELHDAVVEGRDAGLRIDWPGSIEGLPAMGISEIAPVADRVAVVAADQAVTELAVKDDRTDV